MKRTIILVNGRPLVAAALIAYLYNSVFPPLLSEEEEADCIRRWQQGDMEARNTLVERNLRLVAHICKKFESDNIDKDDLISIGTIGLIKAINTFSPEKKVKLATYSARCIENEVLMHFRASRNQKREVSLYDPMGHDKEGNEVSLIDILGSRGETVQDKMEQEEEKQLLQSKLPILEEKERTVLCFRYGLSGFPRKTQREIARQLGISRSYVSRIEKKAVDKLRQAFRESQG
ncbi:MAG: RNA polymerase sporulation sigma factor SigK [Firmicutes bacterium]|nr:RNA polymerase sporulation sigma factor SigK [Bacillota bacterium]